MSDVPSFLTPPVVMACVATALAAAAIYVVTRPVATEEGVYGKRILGTMLSAGAIILGGFSYALASWGTGS